MAGTFPSDAGPIALLALWTLWLLVAIVLLGNAPGDGERLGTLLRNVLLPLFVLLGAAVLGTGAVTWHAYVLASLLVYIPTGIAAHLDAPGRSYRRGAATAVSGVGALTIWIHDGLPGVFWVIGIVIAALVLTPPAVLGRHAIVRLRAEVAALGRRLTAQEQAAARLADAYEKIGRDHAELRRVYETSRQEIAGLRRTLDAAQEEITGLSHAARRPATATHVARPATETGTATDRSDTRVVLLDVYLTPAEPAVMKSTGVPDTDDPGPIGIPAAAPVALDERFGIAVRRRVITQRSATPGAIRDTERACAREPGKAREYIDDMLASYAAGRIVDSTFDQVTEWWTTRDPLDLGRLAEGVDGADEQLHEVLLGEPVERVGDALGLPGPLADLAGGVASAGSLPTDVVPREARMVLEIAGVCAGALAGVPVLSTACMKAFAHDAVLQGVTEGIKAGLESVCETPVASEIEDRPFTLDDLAPRQAAHDLPSMPEVSRLDDDVAAIPTINDESEDEGLGRV